jgi:peptidoglycan/xylan/chitin deacetylase (PgdA/CDA1 family)
LKPEAGKINHNPKCTHQRMQIMNKKRVINLHLHMTILIIVVFLSILSETAQSASSAVIISYHRFGESGYPSTNIKLKQLDAHIKELKSGPYTVLPVTEIIEKLKAKKSLPDRTVGITIDDAYRSIYTEAWPKLKAANLPFTVFISTAHVDHGSIHHLTWNQIREMRAMGVDFGHHSVSHLHMPKATPTSITQEIEFANQRFEKELGLKPKLFAYPYGEASRTVKNLIKNAGFIAAFGQHSGVIDGTGDFTYLPRFSLNEKFGGMTRFRILANALSIPVRDMTPNDPLITVYNPPAIGFTVRGQLASPKADLSRLSCFLNHDGQGTKSSILGPRIEIRSQEPMPIGRTRLNCTMPTKQGRWRWFGHQFIRIK